MYCASIGKLNQCMFRSIVCTTFGPCAPAVILVTLNRYPVTPARLVVTISVLILGNVMPHCDGETWVAPPDANTADKQMPVSYAVLKLNFLGKSKQLKTVDQSRFRL